MDLTSSHIQSRINDFLSFQIEIVIQSLSMIINGRLFFLQDFKNEDQKSYLYCAPAHRQNLQAKLNPDQPENVPFFFRK